MSQPRRGDVWLADMEPVRGHEQGGRRPVLIVSRDSFNGGPAGLVVVLPISGTRRDIPLTVLVDDPEGGLRHPSAVYCDGIRSISKRRLVECWGQVSAETLAAVEHRLRGLLVL
ncbi:MAG: type II toxin-antitoxin system PemK/MazF family toxin [Armatimonadetes bacterium]|nr:type II toxin-antitoxin system PemK/MazF family toxin [Armatimonadota bacterium]